MGERAVWLARGHCAGRRSLFGGGRVLDWDSFRTQMNFTLAMIQMRVEGGQKQSNLEHARELIWRAAGQGAQVVLLPEAMPLGWTHSSARKEADAIPAGER